MAKVKQRNSSVFAKTVGQVKRYKVLFALAVIIGGTVVGYRLTTGNSAVLGIMTRNSVVSGNAGTTSIVSNQMRLTCAECAHFGADALLLSVNGGSPVATCMLTAHMKFYAESINDHRAAFIDCRTNKLVTNVPATSFSNAITPFPSQSKSLPHSLMK